MSRANWVISQQLLGEKMENGWPLEINQEMQRFTKLKIDDFLMNFI